MQEIETWLKEHRETIYGYCEAQELGVGTLVHEADGGLSPAFHAHQRFHSCHRAPG